MTQQKYKIAVVLFDGMADLPDSNGNTPMTLATKPTADYLASKSEVGLCQTVPFGLKPGSDVANLSVMGYDPRKYYTGRSPLEALSMGIKLEDTSITYRANIVTLSGEPEYCDKTMLDYSAGEVSTPEAKELIEFLSNNLPLNGLQLYAGVSYRHCLVRKNATIGSTLTPPHDISDKKITDHLPKGNHADELLMLMKESYNLLKDHPINIKRIAEGKKPANSLWFWGEGKKPLLPDFYSTFGMHGAIISAVDLLKGIGLAANMTSIDVEGATGNLHTNFAGKADAAINALKTLDYVYVHLEAPDECGHQGDKEGKTKAISIISEKVLKPIYEALKKAGNPFKILVIPDHATPVKLKTHTMDAVPYFIYTSDKEQLGVTPFNEFTAKTTNNFVNFGFDLLPKLQN